MAARGVTTSYRSSDGLTTRQMGLRLRNRPMHDDFVCSDRFSNVQYNEIARIVRELRYMAQEIEAETRYQNDFMNDLQMTMIKVQASLKNNMRRLNRSMVRNDIMHVILFAPFCCFLVYLWSKFSTH